MWFQGAHTGTIWAFHERDTTLQKTLEVNVAIPFFIGVPRWRQSRISTLFSVMVYYRSVM